MDATSTNSKLEKDGIVDSRAIDYTVWILHIRPEIGNTEFLLSYKAKEHRDKKFVEEMFSKAFRSAHPSWIIKKVTIEEKP